MRQEVFTVTECLIVRGEGVESELVDQLVCDFDGIIGDRHAGRTRRAGPREAHVPKGTDILNNRQFSAVERGELIELADRLGLPQVAAASLGANLVLQGVLGVSDIPAGCRLVFGEHGPVLVVHYENFPCTAPGKVLAAEHPRAPNLIRRFVEEARGLRGIVGWVERPGIIRPGDTATIWSVSQTVR